METCGDYSASLNLCRLSVICCRLFGVGSRGNHKSLCIFSPPSGTEKTIFMNKSHSEVFTFTPSLMEISSSVFLNRLSSDCFLFFSSLRGDEKSFRLLFARNVCVVIKARRGSSISFGFAVIGRNLSARYRTKRHDTIPLRINFPLQKKF